MAIKNLGRVKGENGKSAYEIWLEQGNTGTEQDFLDSLKGEKGEPGEGGGSVDIGSVQFDLVEQPVLIQTMSTTLAVEEEQETADISASVNLFNKEKVKDNYIVVPTVSVDSALDGEEYPQNNYALTNFIKVKPNTSYTITGVGGGKNVGALYDKDKSLPCVEYIRLDTIPSGKFTFTTTEDTQYLRVNIFKGSYSVNTYMVCEADKYPDSYVAFVDGSQLGETYTVTYNTNNHGEQPEAVSGVTSLPNPLPTLTASGYVFAGWYLDEGLTQIATGGATISADTTLYAKWVEEEIETYTITFEENGGSEVQDLAGQTEIPSSLPIPVRNGYLFEAWYTDSALTNLAVAGTELISNITLYAKWSKEPSEPIEGVQNVVANFNGQQLEEYMLEGLKINKENVIGLDDGDTSQTNYNVGGGYPEKMAFIGDSLTYGSTVTGGSPYYYQNYYNYPYFACGKLNAKEYTKIAIPGGTSTTLWERRATDISNITDSVAVIFLGTNNGLSNTISTDCDGDDPSSYANTLVGNYGKIIKTLQNNGNKVVLCQCFHTTNNLTNTNATISALGERFGCDVVLISQETRTELMLQKYHTAYNGTVDNIHFNNIGHLKFAEVVCEQLKQFMFENPYKYEMYKPM